MKSLKIVTEKSVVCPFFNPIEVLENYLKNALKTILKKSTASP